jgi:tetratricopeptide (TPR) repeat protein
VPSIFAWAYLDTQALDEAQDAIAGITDIAAWSTTIFGRPEHTDVLRVGALIALRQQRWADAKASLDHAIDAAHYIACPYAEAKALYVYGQLYMAKHEPEQAREKFERALAICDRLGEGLYHPHIDQALAGLAAVAVRHAAQEERDR